MSSGSESYGTEEEKVDSNGYDSDNDNLCDGCGVLISTEDLYFCSEIACDNKYCLECVDENTREIGCHFTAPRDFVCCDCWEDKIEDAEKYCMIRRCKCGNKPPK